MRVAFWGNGEFGVPTLERLKASAHTIVGVFTNPPARAGRGLQLTPTPIQLAAERLGLPLFPVTDLKIPALLQQVSQLKAEVFVVVAYRILPPALWSLPVYGAINLHPSLLPAYRGAAPIEWTLINGEKITGVTTFKIQAGIDTGPLLMQEPYPVPMDWNAGQLRSFLAEMGAQLMEKTLEGLALNTLTPTFQKPGQYPYAPKLTPENTRINWNQPAEKIYNLVRGLAPTPGAWCLFQGKKLFLYQVSFTKQKRPPNFPVGTVWEGEGHIPLVCAQDKVLEINLLKLEGGKTLKGKDFVSGYVKRQRLQLE
ncbi:MAG: methionyl-tRNA formyltransferase [Bacteroidia bacterium]